MSHGETTLGVVIVQNHREELYEDGNYQEHLNQEEIRNEEFFEEMPVFEARWIVIYMVVVAPLWIWPFEFPAIFAEFGISILKGSRMACWLSDRSIFRFSYIILDRGCAIKRFASSAIKCYQRAVSSMKCRHSSTRNC